MLFCSLRTDAVGSKRDSVEVVKWSGKQSGGVHFLASWYGEIEIL